MESVFFLVLILCLFLVLLIYDLLILHELILISWDQHLVDLVVGIWFDVYILILHFVGTRF